MDKNIQYYTNVFQNIYICQKHQPVESQNW